MYNGEESFASGKNLAEIKECIAEDIGVASEKLIIHVKTAKDGKSKKIGSQKIFEAYLKMSGYNEEDVIEIINADSATSTPAASSAPKRKLFRHQCYGLSEDKVSSTTIGSSTWPMEPHLQSVDAGTLSTLEARSVKFYKVGSLLSFKTTLSNGMTSEF